MRVWLDCETTGFSHRYNDIIQIGAYITDESNKYIDTFKANCSPHNPNTINEGASKVHGISKEEMLAFPHPMEVAEEFVKWLEKYPGQKRLCGFNVGFDQSFLEEWFYKCGVKGKYVENFMVTSEMHDTLKVAQENRKKIGGKCFKLTSLCKRLGIPLNNAHDALEDITATVKLDNKIRDIISDDTIAEVLDIEEIKSGESEVSRTIVYDGRYLAINGNGSIYISEHTTRDPKKLLYILKYLENTYCPNSGENLKG